MGVGGGGGGWGWGMGVGGGGGGWGWGVGVGGGGGGLANQKFLLHFWIFWSVLIFGFFFFSAHAFEGWLPGNSHFRGV